MPAESPMEFYYSSITYLFGHVEHSFSVICSLFVQLIVIFSQLIDHVLLSDHLEKKQVQSLSIQNKTPSYHRGIFCLPTVGKNVLQTEKLPFYMFFTAILTFSLNFQNCHFFSKKPQNLVKFKKCKYFISIRRLSFFNLITKRSKLKIMQLASKPYKNACGQTMIYWKMAKTTIFKTLK